ncbi:MAG: Rrf2 family transcriptional regulator [Polyangiaceae bacterium]|nr:Rrf2 family transcriptional regulator [Polyangiaceae bacterium]
MRTKSPTTRPRKLPIARRDGIAPVSQSAEYALRVMTCLARGDQIARTATDLAAEASVPVHYLSKVLRRLVAAGLLSSQKGHGGGFVLARPASKIRFADVLGAMGEAPVGGRCAFGWGKCDAKNPCPLHPAWSALSDALQSWAGDTTLADVAAAATHKRPKRRG